jgi:hypothetical protein
MEARRESGENFSLTDALSIVVPLCTQLAKLHAQGKTFFVHPSSLFYTDNGVELVEAHAHQQPTHPHDRSCLAPETRKGAAGDARASVFSIGAIFYELLTGESVGPGMRRPTEVVPDLPPTLEVILGKALIADPTQRPPDITALAAALYQTAPVSGSEAPPPSENAAKMSLANDASVDARTSMLPPSSASAASGVIPKAPRAPSLQAVSGDGPFAVAIRAPVKETRPANDPTSRLADMKARLESDPRPRYVVVKEGMDHGPFNAVELLQQIATGSFASDHVLRDAFTSEERFIKEWEEFAPFAEQAKLNRDIVKEKKALEAVVVAEKKGTQYKALIGLAVIGVFLAGGAGWLARQKANKERELDIQGQTVTPNVEVSAGLGAGKPGAGGPMGGGAARPGGGSYPVVSGGTSCEAAQSKYVEDWGKSSPPDLTAGAYARVLNNGGYLNACNVPSNMEVNVCAAVQNGRAVGVTVSTSPPNAGISSCVAAQVRGMSFPAHPRLDVARTTFASAN